MVFSDLYIFSSETQRILSVLKPRINLYAAIHFRLKYIVFEAKAFPLARGIAVVDIETSGLDAKRHNLLTIGVYREDRITIFQLLFGSDLRRIKTAMDFINEIKKKYRCYAWFKDFEESWLGFGFRELQIANYEKKDRAIKIDGLESRFSGRDVPRLWEAWKQTGDICCILAIVERNYMDLLTEAAALVRFPLYTPRTLLPCAEDFDYYGDDYEDE